VSASMKVPLLDLRRTTADLDVELQQAFVRVLESGHYILGPEVDALEKECAAYIGTEDAIGVSSGTDALLLALMSLGIGPGDEVVCPTFTFFATAGTIWRTGARPVLADCSLRDFNCEASALADKVTSRTRALMPVHLFGQCADVAALASLVPEIPIIEDAAQALGAAVGERKAGTTGAFGCFSFFPSKNLGGLGDSGLVTTRDPALGELARVMRSHGGKPKYHHRVVGGNFRIDALQAALLRPKLRRLSAWTAQRRANAALYTQLLSSCGVAAPNEGDKAGPAPVLYPVENGTGHIYNQYCLRVTGGRRDALREHLQESGVGTEVYYPVPMHLQECFSSLGHKRQAFPNAELASEQVLAVPIFPELTPAEIEYVVSCIVRFFR
jgi:dTDP-4-amino-4,6-dideoxygalactose transaminase